MRFTRVIAGDVRYADIGAVEREGACARAGQDIGERTSGRKGGSTGEEIALEQQRVTDQFDTLLKSRHPIPHLDELSHENSWQFSRVERR